MKTSWLFIIIIIIIIIIITLCLVEQSSPTFFQHQSNYSWSLAFSIFVPSMRLQSKFKVVRNCAKMWTFFALPNFRGWAFQKLYPNYHAWLHGNASSIPKGVQMLNFKSNFKSSPLTFYGKPVPTRLGCTLAILRECLVHVKFLRGMHP